MYRIENVDKTEKIERLTYSILEVAKAIGVSSRTVHKLYKSGELGHIRVGQRVLVPADVLRQFIEQRTSGGRPLGATADDDVITWAEEEGINPDPCTRRQRQ